MTKQPSEESNQSLLRKNYKPGMPARVLCGLSAIVAASALPLLLLVMASAACAQTTLITLHTFSGSSGNDGANSYAPLVQDSAGNLYGTTAGGGTFHQGIVFRVDTSGNETVLYNFTGGTDGGNPRSGLLLDAAGNLYGITAGGGIFPGQGVVFKLDPSGVETVLHPLTTADGSGSASGLIRDPSGNFYGTTERGGAYDQGVAFKVDTLGNYSVVHSFGKRRVADGSEPFAGLVRDAAGNLYGTTFSGGRFGSGTVFKIDASGNESVIYSFRGGSDGLDPSSNLVLDVAGNLYGTTDAGGVNGVGTVFKVSASGHEKILHSFGSPNDGASPFVGLVKDESGNFYGVTDRGGVYGHGSVFRVDNAGNETVLYSFTGSSDGARPEAALWRDAAGNLFGTTLDRGSGHDAGTVFELTFP
ncbi:MAG TPA: choice-of-anchor tandem repeat GloVer-containing protein [Candidatus Acidoferrum sp.]|nr:choice-of-anchor tandem repeat GloVer-containing protein [Candidatus Acidoferrum sp.]